MRARLFVCSLFAVLSVLIGGGNALAAGGMVAAHPVARDATARYAPDSQDCQFLSRINSYRKQNGLGTLKLSKALGAAAVHHSIDMATNDVFSHTLSDGTSWSQNIANYGYPSNSTRGENIAAGYAAATDTFTQWKNSPAHNANMLNSKYKVIGIARKYDANSTYGWYWTTTFGSVVDTTVSC